MKHILIILVLSLPLTFGCQQKPETVHATLDAVDMYQSYYALTKDGIYYRLPDSVANDRSYWKTEIDYEDTAMAITYLYHDLRRAPAWVVVLKKPTDRGKYYFVPFALEYDLHSNGQEINNDLFLLSDDNAWVFTDMLHDMNERNINVPIDTLFLKYYFRDTTTKGFLKKGEDAEAIIRELYPGLNKHDRATFLKLLGYKSRLCLYNSCEYWFIKGIVNDLIIKKYDIFQKGYSVKYDTVYRIFIVKKW